MSFSVVISGAAVADVERRIVDEFAIAAPSVREDVVLIAQAQVRAVVDLLLSDRDKVDIRVSGHDNGHTGRVPGWASNGLNVSVTQVYTD